MSDTKVLPQVHVEAFLRQSQLPETFRHTLVGHYAPLAVWAQQKRASASPLILGIGGAPGSGKSTLAEFINCVLANEFGAHVAVLSLDDFYYKKAERKQLGKRVHPLLKTRGVPGTHDLPMLFSCLQALKALQVGENILLPRFDKARDDRASKEDWPQVAGPIDIVILEGWCIGSRAQPASELARPINRLEREHDSSGVWRNYVNQQLKQHYAALSQQLDVFVYLQVADFDAVNRWRYDQELKLAAAADTRRKMIMDQAAVQHFMQHFERIVRADMACLPTLADVTLVFDSGHHCVQSNYKT